MYCDLLCTKDIYPQVKTPYNISILSKTQVMPMTDSQWNILDCIQPLGHLNRQTIATNPSSVYFTNVVICQVPYIASLWIYISKARMLKDWREIWSDMRETTLWFNCKSPVCESYICELTTYRTAITMYRPGTPHPIEADAPRIFGRRYPLNYLFV